jgi:hypothetical protein
MQEPNWYVGRRGCYSSTAPDMQRAPVARTVIHDSGEAATEQLTHDNADRNQEGCRVDVHASEGVDDCRPAQQQHACKSGVAESFSNLQLPFHVRNT